MLYPNRFPPLVSLYLQSGFIPVGISIGEGRATLGIGIDWDKAWVMVE
jgi:hypothetical protein